MCSYSKSITAVVGSLLVLVSLGCEKKLNVDTYAAQEDAKANAKAADIRVAVLEQQLADLKSGKHQPDEADPAIADHVWKSQAKALERQLLDARESAEWKRKASMGLPLDSRLAHHGPRSLIVNVPEGTAFSVRVAKELTTSTVSPGDSWRGALTEDVVVKGTLIWRAGSEVQGVVTQSLPAGRLSSGRGSLGIKATYLGQEDVDSTVYVVVGDKRGARHANMVGGSQALGTLVGLLSDNHDSGYRALDSEMDSTTAATNAGTVIKISPDLIITFSLEGSEEFPLKP